METPPAAAAPANSAHRPSPVSRLLAAGQLALLAGLAATAARPGPGEFGIIVAGGGLGLWALAAMPIRQLRVVPETHPAGRLVRSGPYRMIRHPMYSAVLLVAAGLLATHPAPARLAMGLALLLL
ncbi:MAG: isoprenylcysteine carboxylmethyltransferase family protein [Kiritimatiellia bacterium]